MTLRPERKFSTEHIISLASVCILTALVLSVAAIEHMNLSSSASATWISLNTITCSKSHVCLGRTRQASLTWTFQETLNRLTGADVRGGKLLAVSSNDFLDVVTKASTVSQLSRLTQKKPTRRPTLRGEEGFWDDRPDWYKRAMALRGARLLAEDCVGGSDEDLQTYLAAQELALDVMRTIPSFSMTTSKFTPLRLVAVIYNPSY